METPLIFITKASTFIKATILGSEAFELEEEGEVEEEGEAEFVFFNDPIEPNLREEVDDEARDGDEEGVGDLEGGFEGKEIEPECFGRLDALMPLSFNVSSPMRL